MKAKALPTFLYLIVALLLTSFSDPYAIKRISDANYRYEFYTTSKKPNPKHDKTYYWFKGGLIHNAQGGIAGELIDAKFVKMYHSNQLAEQGFFKNGLKVGLWKTWYPNGTIETTQKWSNGLRSGQFYHYDDKGLMIENGNFKNNQKHGKWVNYTAKDTIEYKKGIIFVKKTKPSKEEIVKLKEEKLKAKTAEKKAKEEAKTKKTTDKNSKKPSSEKKPKKESFFKKIFNKKQSNQNKNG